MQKIPKRIAIIAVVIVVTVAVYWRQVANVLQTGRPNEVAPAMVVADKPKEVSVDTGYEVPNDGYDKVRFILVLDQSGIIIEAREVNPETNAADEHQEEFAKNLTTVIKGKKLSELAPVDRIGKSSLTTKAFNSVIDQLKSQI